LIRVAVDGRALFDGSEHRGLGTYVRRVLTGLAATPDITPVALVPASTPLPDGVGRVAVRRFLPRRLSTFEHDLVLPWDLARAKADVVHSPAQHPPRRSAAPWVQTLHDVTPLVFEHPLLAADARRWRRIGPRMRDAAAVIADSRFSADQGVRFFGLDPGKIHVVHLGVDAGFRPPASRVEPETPYFLFVGAWGPHKGLPEAVDAIGRLADAGCPHRLAVAGFGDAWMSAHVEEASRLGSRPERVDVLGYVEDLVRLYQQATALLMTSRAEGFGLPAAEAMACGTPVIAFANTSIVEVVADGGILVPDGDVAALVAAARSLVDDQGAWEMWSERARARGATFSWEKTVAGHAEILRAVAETPVRS
jgi:glycosyltransferase involved in cell wall biosynthesis